jgi:hypothetical protein
MLDVRRREAICVLAGGLLLAAGACRPGPTSPARRESTGEPSTAANHGISDLETSVRLAATAYFAGQDFAPGFGPPTFGRSSFGGRCSVPSDYVIRFDLEGESTHLGRVTADVEHCSRLDFTTGLSAISDGVMTIVAGNGDELWGRYERVAFGGEGDPEHVRWVGGTGRFVSATGEALSLVACDRAAGTCEYELDGVISYDASDAGQ